MLPAFISGCLEYLPNASITFDKFHIIKEVNKAMEELRRMESKEYKALKGHKYLFLKNKVTQDQRNLLNHFTIMYPKPGEGYRFVQMFKDFWGIEDIEVAKGYMGFWCDIVMESGIQPFIKVAKLIKSHWTGVVNYIESKITNGVLEGINTKIQLTKKGARGYRDINNFINMIYFICGKLEFYYPLLLLFTSPLYLINYRLINYYKI